jgi:hypothetical protein
MAPGWREGLCEPLSFSCDLCPDWSRAETKLWPRGKRGGEDGGQRRGWGPEASLQGQADMIEAFIGA